jgi:hypothetical protein
VDPDPPIHAKKVFSACYFLKTHLHHFIKIKSQKEVPNSRNQGFSYNFCLMIEGSGDGFIPLTRGTGSGSRRPRNIWILWIRIRIQEAQKHMDPLDPEAQKHMDPDPQH